MSVIPSREIKFKGVIHRISIDNEGEGTLTLKIPLSDLSAVKTLSDYIERELKITIKKID